MALPSSGPITLDLINTQSGGTTGTTVNLNSLVALLKSAPATKNVAAFYSTEYYQKNNAGNCPSNPGVSFCVYNCNCGNLACNQCYPVPVDCWNCDIQGWFQSNCNCEPSPTTNYFGAPVAGGRYNCNYGLYTTDCGTPANCPKIICTKLYQLGMMPHHIFVADQEYGRILKRTDRKIYRGYIRWARLVTAWMSGEGPDFMVWIKDKNVRKQKEKEFALKWSYKIATPWSRHMAYLMGAIDNDNLTGRILMKFGRVASRIAYSLPKSKLTCASGLITWGALIGSYYIADTISVLVNKPANIQNKKETLNGV